MLLRPVGRSGLVGSSLRRGPSTGTARSAVLAVRPRDALDRSRRFAVVTPASARHTWPSLRPRAGAGPLRNATGAESLPLQKRPRANRVPRFGWTRNSRQDWGATLTIRLSLIGAHARRVCESTMHDWRWTNRSVALMAGDTDPVDAISDKARKLVLDALDKGWRGPPFDPFWLANLCKIEFVAKAGVRDARTVPVGRGQRFRIEFNPTRPAARVRYSVAHEIAHTLFPDCATAVRHRAARSELAGDEWQLEALCNVAAAELLMPLGSFPNLREESMTIERLVELRRTFAVSTEALLIRAVRVTDVPVVAFAASRIEEGTHKGGYRVEYMIPSHSSTAALPRGTVVSADSALAECTGIGFTAICEERWPGWGTAYRVECVGIPPYPGSRYPRVAGVLRDRAAAGIPSMLEFVRGDATRPRTLPAIVAQVVSNKARTWGGKGFAVAVRRRWPSVHDDFRKWARSGLTLGDVQLAPAEPDVYVASMVAQSGYGPSKHPRIRYAALRRALASVTQMALDTNAAVHMPRIGTGEAGGAWTIVEELVRDECIFHGVSVTVYDLPGAPIPASEQRSLPLTVE